MEDKSRELTKEQKLEREFEQIKRERKIARARASVVRTQIVRAYEILENIKFDFVSDTAFRDKIVRAKRSLESALDDFLMSDRYHEKDVDKFNAMSLNDFKEWQNQGTVSGAVV